MSMLEKELDNRYITRYLLSDMKKERFAVAASATEGETNVWAGYKGAASYKSAARDAFIAYLASAPVELPQLLDAQPGGSVKLRGEELKLNYSVPFGDPVTGCTAFLSTPFRMSAVAYTILYSPDERDIELECAVKGSLKLFLNENLAIDYRPFMRNEEVKETFGVHLNKGGNPVILLMDEFGERDSECTASLRVVKGDEGLMQRLPMGERDVEKINALESAMASLAFTRNNFTSGEVTMVCANPFKDEDLIFHLEGATEENTYAGKLCSADAVFKHGSNEASLGPVESFPVGFLRMTVTAECEGLVMKTIRTFEAFPLSFLDKPAPTCAGRKQQAWKFLAKYGEENANRAMALLYTDGDRDEIETLLRRQIEFINRRSDCSDFYLSYFPHMIRKFSESGLIREETLNDMKDCLLNFRYWHDEPGDDAMWFYSENHALMFHVCQLIAGELYPDEIFTNSGMTGLEMQEKAVRMLRPWFESFFKEGFTEWNSPPYLPIDALGFASLYAQTENEEMKKLAKRGMDYIIYLLSVTSFDGIFSTTSGRTYLKELFGNNSNCPSFINWIAYGIGNESHAGKGSVPFCFSGYEPDEKWKAYHIIPPGKALSWKSTHGYNGHCDVTVYKTNKYLLSAADNFKPGARGQQQDVVHAVMSALEHVFINHPGEAALFGQARPSYWAGNGVLPRADQYKGFASVSFVIDEEHPVGFTHVYWPETDFKASFKDGLWHFAESHKGGYIALWNDKESRETVSGPNLKREFIVDGRKTQYFIRMSSSEEFASFEAFADACKSCRITYDPSSVAWTFDDWAYGKLEGGFDEPLVVNGKAEEYSGYGPEGKVTIE